MAIEYEIGVSFYPLITLLMLAFIVYLVGALMGAWTFFGYPASLR